MSRGKNCLPIVSRQFLTRNYPRLNRLLKCLPNCLSPTGEGIFSSFKITPAVRVIARQLRDKNSPGAIFALGHQDVSQGPLGTLQGGFYQDPNLSQLKFPRTLLPLWGLQAHHVTFLFGHCPCVATSLFCRPCSQKGGFHSEVLNGVGVDGVGLIFPVFFCAFSTHFLCFS